MMNTTTDVIFTDSWTTGIPTDYVQIGSSTTPGVIALKTTIVSFICISIIITNILNLCVIQRMKQLPKVARLFLLNLSASDLTVGMIACSPAIYSAATEEWPYGAEWCQISGIIHGTSVTVSIWSISVVGIDRYIAVYKPFVYATLREAGAQFYGVLVGLWVAAIVTFSVPLFTKPNFIYYKFNPGTGMCGMHWEYRSFCIVTGVYIPILSGSILTFTSIQIIRKLKDQSKKKPSKKTEAKNASTRKTLQILVITAVIYFTCWTPYVMLVFAEAFGNNIKAPDWLHFVSIWTANSNSMMNVFIYSATNPAFRQTLQRMFLPCYRGKVIPITTLNESATENDDSLSKNSITEK